MRRVIVGSTTHIDRHNTRMTKQALESMANQINGHRKPVFTIEHDVALPPIGQLLQAWVEPIEGEVGEYQLFIEQEIFEKEEDIILPNGLKALKVESDTDKHPFINKTEGSADKFILHLDFANFASLSSYEAFLDEVKAASSIPFKSSEIGRKTFIPDPELIITLSRDILTYFIAKKIIDKFSDKISDKLTDKISDDIAEFYIWVKSIASRYVKYAIPQNRPITYIFSVPISPHVELVARTNNAEEVTASIMLENLEEPLRLAQEYKNILGAERVQFLLDKKGEWKFNYILTNKGQVIGTKKSFLRKPRQFDLDPPKNMIGSNGHQPKSIKQPFKTPSRATKRKKKQ